MNRVAMAVCLALTAAWPCAAAQIGNAARPSLVMGADGRGLVAYQDTETLDLEVAHCADADCSAVTVSTLDSAGDVGLGADIVLRPGGLPAVSYLDSTNGDLKLALCADPVCASSTTTVVDSSLVVGSATSIAMGGDGRILMAYAGGPPDPFSGMFRLRAAHCENAGCTSATISDLGDTDGDSIDLEIAGDGRGVLVLTQLFPLQGVFVSFHHCADLACSSATVSFGGREGPSLDVGPDGLPISSFIDYTPSFVGSLRVRRCLDHACTTFTEAQTPATFGDTSLAITSTGLPRVVAPFRRAGDLEELRLFECADAGCTTHQETCFAPWGTLPSLALDGRDQPLVAFERGGRVEIGRPSGPCVPTLTTGDKEGPEDTPGDPLRFDVRLDPPATQTLTVAYTTVDGTAQAGSDYVAQSGVLTFAPGEYSHSVFVPLIPDTLDEPNETFELVLSSPGVPFAQARAVGTILDNDEPVVPTVSVADCVVVEGNTGNVGCEFLVRLSGTFPSLVTVQYGTANGTAAAPGDYLAQAGTLTFPPGTTLQTVTVPVVGDLLAEPDESFELDLSPLANVDPGDTNARGQILDNDWPVLPGPELSHGSSLQGDFQPDAGPVPDRDDYRIALAPFASYEVVLDAVSGDATPGVRLERIASDGSTVIDVAEPVGTGSALSLRFVNTLTIPVESQYVRVSAPSCGTGCGPDDTYRIRAYETTGRIPRFNNAGNQVTIVLLQNTTDKPLLAEVHFWDSGGALLATQGALMAPHGTSVIAMPSLAGTSGSISVTHFGPYGAIAGKAVALEPATGFSFDSPMTSRPR